MFEVSFVPGSRGYWPNQSPEGPVADTIIAGNDVSPHGPGKLVAFTGYGLATGLGGAVMMPVAATSGGLGTGSVIYYRNASYWWVGSGTVVVGSTSIGTATSSLQYRIGLAGTTYTAGVVVPGTPVLSTFGVGNMSGTYSVKIAWKRSWSGAVGNASVASAAVSASSQRLQLQLPAVPTGTTAVDRVIVYSSARGFAATGPWLFLSEHPVTPTLITGTVNGLGPNGNGQWADGDRAAELAPIDNDTPPTGTHCCGLGNLMVVPGCYGGSGVAWSNPASPEAFNPNNVAFLPADVIGLLPRASDGFAYVWGSNYLAAIVLVPGGLVIPRTMWGNTGMSGADNACLVESELWGYTDEPVRTTQDSAPDTTFGLAVRDYMRANWTTPASVVVGYSPRDNAVVYCYGPRNEALAYYRSMDAWSAPLTSGNIQAAVTVGQQLRVAVGSSLFSFGTPTAGLTATAITPFYEPMGAYTNTISNVRTGLRGSGTTTIDVLTNYDQLTSKASQTITGASGDYFSTWLRCNVLNATAVALKYTFSGTIYKSVLDGKTRRAHIVG
jgi:hypothetical protein